MLRKINACRKEKKRKEKRKKEKLYDTQNIVAIETYVAEREDVRRDGGEMRSPRRRSVWGFGEEFETESITIITALFSFHFDFMLLMMMKLRLRDSD